MNELTLYYSSLQYEIARRDTLSCLQPVCVGMGFGGCFGILGRGPYLLEALKTRTCMCSICRIAVSDDIVGKAPPPYYRATLTQI